MHRIMQSRSIALSVVLFNIETTGQKLKLLDQLANIENITFTVGIKLVSSKLNAVVS